MLFPTAFAEYVGCGFSAICVVITVAADGTLGHRLAGRVVLTPCSSKGRLHGMVSEGTFSC